MPLRGRHRLLFRACARATFGGAGRGWTGDESGGRIRSSSPPLHAMSNCTHARPCWLQLPLLHRLSCLAAFSSLGLRPRSTTQHDVKGQTAGRQAGALLHLLARAHHPRRHRHGSCRPARLPSASCDLPRSRPTCPHAARTGTTHRQRVTQRSFATPAYGPPGSLPPMLTCVPCARRALAADLHVQRVAARRRDRDADRHGVPVLHLVLARWHDPRRHCRRSSSSARTAFIAVLTRTGSCQVALISGEH